MPSRAIRQLLPLSEASRALRLHPRTLKRWNRSGRLPFALYLSPTGRYLVRKSDLEAYLRGDLLTRRFPRPLVRPAGVSNSLWAERMEAVRRAMP